MAHLALSFLCGFQVELDGRPVIEFKSNKVRALLAYLAVEAGRPHRREALAGLLWPDRTDRDALSNLRYSLASLRRTLGDRLATHPFLLITHETIQFNRASDTWLDVAQLEHQIANARKHHLGDADVADLKSALSLYRSSFLEDFSVGDAAPFEEWALMRREQIAQQVITALGDLIAALEGRGEFGEAQTYARQQVALEPWNEAAHRALMRALALNGQRNAALHQFQTCRRVLQGDLGVEPAEETIALYQLIRKGEGETNRQVGKDGNEQGAGELSLSTSAPVYSPTSSPVVAREEQLARLDGFLVQAFAGSGRVIFVVGEAGSGKTALLGEFARRAMKSRATLLVASGACDAAAGIGDPYLPFREILQLLTGDIESKRAGTTLTPEHARRLWAAIPDVMQALMEQGPGLIDTFVPGSNLAVRAEAFAGRPGNHPAGAQRNAWFDRLQKLLQASPEVGGNGDHATRKTGIFEQVTGVLQALACRHPLFLVLDDLQWADAGSLSLLFHLGRRLVGSRILVAVAYRPEAIALQPEAGRHSLELVINELRCLYGDPPVDLDACEGRQFVEALLDSEPNRLDADFREQLFRHTEGHPLFTVELLRGLEEQGDLVLDADGCWIARPALHWEKLPMRVDAVIAVRVGRLPEYCQELLGVASVEGEEFTAEALARVLALDEPAILHCLSDVLAHQHRMVTAVSLQRLGAHRISRYRFRHSLFRQYLYDHLDAVRRARLHEAIGEALEQLAGDAPDELDALAPRLAWHFEAAGLAERAAAYHLRTGNRAARVSAYDEAIAHFTRGSILLETLPDSPERMRLKLGLQLAAVSP